MSTYDPETRRALMACDKDIMSELRRAGLPEERADAVARNIWHWLAEKMRLSSTARDSADYQRGVQDGFRRGLDSRDRINRVKRDFRRENA